MKKIICSLLVVMMMASAMCNQTQTVSAKTTTKKVVIWKMTNKKMVCRKSIMASKYWNKSVGWENLIGYGKSKKIKISSKAKYYLLGIYSNKLKKVSRAEFKKSVKIYKSKKLKEKGKVYYWGMACKITIKNGKIVKIKQEYQA